MYALNIGEDGRILSATYPKYAPADAVLVETLPDGNIADYLFVGGAYVHDPLPKVDETEEVNLRDRVTELEEALDLLLSGVTE